MKVLLLLSGSLFLLAGTDAIKCPENGWTAAKTICYRIVHFAESFWAAKAWCKTVKGDLLSLGHVGEVMDDIGESMQGNAGDYRIDGWSDAKWFHKGNQTLTNNDYELLGHFDNKSLTVNLQDKRVTGEAEVATRLGFICEGREEELAAICTHEGQDEGGNQDYDSPTASAEATTEPDTSPVPKEVTQTETEPSPPPPTFPTPDELRVTVEYLELRYVNSSARPLNLAIYEYADADRSLLGSTFYDRDNDVWHNDLQHANCHFEDGEGKYWQLGTNWNDWFGYQNASATMGYARMICIIPPFKGVYLVGVQGKVQGDITARVLSMGNMRISTDQLAKKNFITNILFCFHAEENRSFNTGGTGARLWWRTPSGSNSYTQKPSNVVRDYCPFK